MSEYTPTTEEVYRAHWRGTPMRSEDGLREHVALDRWLAEVKAQERQKLIAELEQEQIYAERASRRPDDEPYVWGFRKAVAVAKGETE